jgi:hypothetical protein
MKKICLNCLCIFHGEIALEYCPIVDCVRCDLVEIDDQMLDVIRGLWTRGVGTKYCCSGHLYERSSGAYLMFDGFYNDYFEMDLADFRELLIAVNGDDSRVSIEEVEERDGVDTFTVRGVRSSAEMNPKQRLKCQVDFVEFFYDVMDRMDALWEELVKQEDVSGVAEC